MPETKLQFTDEQLEAATYWAQFHGFPTVEAFFVDHYVQGNLVPALANVRKQEAESKVAAFTPESKALVEAFDKQKEGERLALIEQLEGEQLLTPEVGEIKP
jgi:hypothetical protein